MSISIFKFGSRHGTTIRLPIDRMADAGRQLRINDKFPDFTARSTKGWIDFNEWAEGSYVLLVSHPAAFTPVCTTEILALAERCNEFEDRKIKVIALTGDPLDRVQEWTAEIERDSGVAIPFPHISDENHAIIEGCGFLSQEPIANGKYCARRTLLIDPQGIVRMIMDYPITVGRSVDETLRCIDALILSERLDAFTPSDWQLGEPLLVNHEMSQREAKLCGRLSEGSENPYFRMIKTTKKDTGSSHPPRLGRFPTISNSELCRLMDEHNHRMKNEPGAVADDHAELLAAFRS